MKKHTKRIIGVDPGTRITGFGVIDVSGNQHTLVTHGVIKPSPKLAQEMRYHTIFENIHAMIKKHQPDALSVETQFVHKNAQSALKLGMARGVILLAATMEKVPVFEYAPKKAKMAVTGIGSASKLQVQKMVEALLSLNEEIASEDAADALALAICHAHYQGTLNYV